MECFEPHCVFTESEELFQLRLEGLELLASARCEGREAASEPRLMGVPWREEPLSLLLWGYGSLLVSLETERHSG